MTVHVPIIHNVDAVHSEMLLAHLSTEPFLPDKWLRDHKSSENTTVLCSDSTLADCFLLCSLSSNFWICNELHFSLPQWSTYTCANMPSASEMKCMMYVGRWVWEGDTLPRIAFNLLKDTAIYDSHLSNMKLCVCVCMCMCACALPGTIMFLLVGVWGPGGCIL